MKNSTKFLLCGLMVLLIGVSVWGAGKFYDYYRNPILVGKWVSEETGQTIEFMSDGKVFVDYIETGFYHITNLDTMVYEIQDQTFEMYYHIDQRDLIWNIIGEADEKFKRK